MDKTNRTILITEAHIKVRGKFGFTLGKLCLYDNGTLTFADKDKNELWHTELKSIKSYKPSHLMGRIKFYADDHKQSIYFWNLRWFEQRDVYRWIRALRKAGVKRKFI